MTDPILIPRGTTLTIWTPPSWGHPRATIPHLVGLALADVSDPTVQAFARSIGSQGTKAERADRLLRAVDGRIRYELDTQPTDDEPTERIRAPHVTLDRGAGDCDCMGGLIFCLAILLGLRPRVCVVAANHPERPHHVWIEVLTENGWTALDPVLQPASLGRHLDGRIVV